ncbi:Hypothetical predicted protein [Olea europaea subsp. europaea]|uniref:Uncharacterized protein n=1 Tax=Olea europaea subsp. europaea TaxID=158383 RepID=A0A8S0V359_OLEEU|nr:Hypothetical predicted protein [Olea europaea subsp. europaea]
MSIKSERKSPSRIGKIGPYTVFVTPPPTPNLSLKSNSPKTPVDVPIQVQRPVEKSCTISFSDYGSASVVQPPPPIMVIVSKKVVAGWWSRFVFLMVGGGSDLRASSDG